MAARHSSVDGAYQGDRLTADLFRPRLGSGRAPAHHTTRRLGQGRCTIALCARRAALLSTCAGSSVPRPAATMTSPLRPSRTRSGTKARQRRQRRRCSRRSPPTTRRTPTTSFASSAAAAATSSSATSAIGARLQIAARGLPASRATSPLPQTRLPPARPSSNAHARLPFFFPASVSLLHTQLLPHVLPAGAA